MKSNRTFTPAAAIAIDVVIVAALALPMLTLGGCSRTTPEPSVSYTLLDGKKSDLASLRGHVVLVNFWSTDCAPCIAEMPQFARTSRQFAPRGFDLLAVSMPYDPPAIVANFAQSRALPFGVAVDMTGELAHAFAVDVTPTTFLINKRGDVVASWVGATDFAELDKRLGLLLAE